MLETLRSYWSIISTIITVVAVPAVGYLYKKYKQTDARQKAVELGVQALLRDRIVQSYYHYEERGWITLHGLENVNAMYKEYHALGGNGAVTALVNTIHELEVRDDKRPPLKPELERRAHGVFKENAGAAHLHFRPPLHHHDSGDAHGP